MLFSLAFILGTIYWLVALYWVYGQPRDYPGNETGGLLLAVTNLLAVGPGLIASIVALILAERAGSKRGGALFLIANSVTIAQGAWFSVVPMIVPGNWQEWHDPAPQIFGLLISGCVYTALDGAVLFILRRSK